MYSVLYDVYLGANKKIQSHYLQDFNIINNLFTEMFYPFVIIT